MQTPSQPPGRRDRGAIRRFASRAVVAAAPEAGSSVTGSKEEMPSIEGFSPPGLLRQLPLALVATLAVLVLPALLAATLLPPRGVLSTLASGALAVLLSLLIARLAASVWQRRRRGSDLVFADLMLWGLVRRWWVERRLSRLSAAYERAARANLTVRVELLEAIALLLEARSPYTYGHCRRVARHAECIARAMHLTSAEVATIRTAALVHDVGKVYTPLELMQRTGPLSDAEREIVMRHAADGARMLAPVKDRGLASIVLHHHERMGGGGHPEGLIGEEIPLGARIVAVANTFDGLTSRRPGRPGRSQSEALALLQAESGSAFDRRVVDTFRECCSARRSVLSLAFLTAVSERLTGALQLPGGIGLAGTSSTAQMLPALGAAGLLALTPGFSQEGARPRAPQPAVASLRAQPPARTYTDGGPETASAHRAGGSVSPLTGRPAHRKTVGRSPSGSAIPSEPPKGQGRPPAAQGQPNGGIQQSLPSSDGPAETASTTTPTSSQPPPTAPPAHEEAPGQTQHAPEPPPQQAPAITTPPITTPAISTPAISLPPVKLPPLNVPPITIPPVTVPPITLPGLKLPLGG
jgi:putative nucleotidyltransferase with HDIG domain